MLRSLLLRSRSMPKLSPPKNALFWKHQQQARPRSSLQEIHSDDRNERTAALIHGKPSAKPSNPTDPTSQQMGQMSLRPQANYEAKRDTIEGHAAGSRFQRQNQAKKTQSLGQSRRKPSKSSDQDHRLLTMGQGTKRKAGAHPEQPPARRSRQVRGPPLKDEAFVRRTMHVPTSVDYPEAPKDIFKTPKESILNKIQGLAEMRSDFVQLNEGTWRCTLSFDSASRNERVESEGRSRKSAENAAYLHFLAKCHELGILMDLINRNSTFNQANKLSVQKAREEEKDAVMDIFNYAARLDTVPQIKANLITRVERRRPRKVIEVLVDLPEQDIHVKGYGKDLAAAQIEAANKFKKQAEDYHARQGIASLVIKESTALTTDNAGKFIEFLRIVRPGIRLELETLQRAAPLGRDTHRMQVKINEEAMGDAVDMVNKKKAEATAWLIASVEMKNRDPLLWPRYLRALQFGHGQILKPIAPMDMTVDEDCSLVMRETLLGARKAGLPDEVEDAIPPEILSEDRRHVTMRCYRPDEVIQRSQHLSRQFAKFTEAPEYGELRRKKADLPMNQYRKQVLELVNDNTYSIIVGATGSGKTTQVPQILLEHAVSTGNGGACRIICTQPRRIAATSVARRVAEERAEKLQDSVGYHVRFDPKPPQPGGSINYCTTGILLQQLQHFPDDVMETASHLVIDEVHERDVLIDFLLILLKKNLQRRKALGKHTPQVILMSATMDTELFAGYFGSANAGNHLECPSLIVPGRTFPVRERYIDEILQDMNAAQAPINMLRSDPKTVQYLESEKRFQRESRNTISQPDNAEAKIDADDRSVIDWRRERKISADGQTVVVDEKETALVPFGLVAATVAHIAKTSQAGAILVFLPGLEEIVRVEKDLRNASLGVDLTDESRFKIYLLHSSITTAQQTVFEPVPEGCRKIILSTNIAETSITIPDVQHVVDTGKLREKQYDQIRRITMLPCTWISKSNSKQRAGRAGRVQDGNYYALFSKERYDSLRVIGLPELLRTDLQEICLDIKAQAFQTPIREFLGEAIEPPPPKTVDTSVTNLQMLDALTEDERITPLGRLLAALPVHPSLGKMIVLGIIFRCLDPMLILGAAHAERSLFLNPLDARAEASATKLTFVEGSGSDHIALLNAIRELRHWRDTHGEGAMRDLAFRNFLHINAFRTIDSTAKQIEEILVDAGLIPKTPAYQRLNSQYGDPSLNENSHKIPLIKSLVLSGLHPNLAVSPSGGRLFRTPGEKNVLVHPSSTNAPKDNYKRASKGGHEAAGVPAGTLFSYSSLAKSNDGNSLFLRDTTQTTPLQASLFGGKLRRNEERGNIIEIDNWLPFYVVSPDRRTAKTIIEFRKALERLLAVTFKELGSAAKGRRMGEKMNYLADEKVREGFAAGLVEVLDRDVTVDERVRLRGWGSTRQVDSYKPSNGRDGGGGGGGASGNRMPSGFMQSLARR